MTPRLDIALVGDRSSTVPAHRAIPLALATAGRAVGVEVVWHWIGTESVPADAELSAFSGLWCVPGSPYRSMVGALRAIRFARETGLPFLGTCGGCQHAVIEYARSVLGWRDAEHAETAPNASRAVVTPLACGLLDGEATIRLLPGSRLAAAYGVAQVHEEYLCRYGINADFASALATGGLRVAAVDEADAPRAVELEGHAFFVATLFQPERAALKGRPSPVVEAFVAACAAVAATAGTDGHTPTTSPFIP